MQFVWPCTRFRLIELGVEFAGEVTNLLVISRAEGSSRVDGDGSTEGLCWFATGVFQVGGFVYQLLKGGVSSPCGEFLALEESKLACSVGGHKRGEDAEHLLVPHGNEVLRSLCDEGSVQDDSEAFHCNGEGLTGLVLEGVEGVLVVKVGAAGDKPVCHRLLGMLEALRSYGLEDLVLFAVEDF